MRVLICGGGTGGHIYPALSVVAKLQEMGIAPADFLWIGTQGEIEEALVPNAGIELATIRGGAIVGVSWRQKIQNAAFLASSTIKVNRLLARFRPDVSLLTGGYVNGPVALIARLHRIPLLIYLPDIEPGTAIRTMSKIAKNIACTAKDSLSFFPSNKAFVVGYPVRKDLISATEMSKTEALTQFDLTSERPTLFVFGGSRGARSINRALMAVLPQLLEEYQVIHLSGNLDWPEVDAFKSNLTENLLSYYRPYPYLEEQMGAAYRAADLIVARAGASMLGECPAFGVPAILVPYPYAWRYQKVNADYLANRGAALRLNDKDLNEKLLPTVRAMFNEPERLARMSVAARDIFVPNADENLAQAMIRMSKRAVS